MRRLMVPVDGSAFAERAFPFAIELAGRAGARLTLIGVHHVRPDERVFGPDVRAEQDRDVLSRYLAGLVETLGSVGDGPVVGHLLDGRPGPAIADWVAREHPDLIVMTTHGRGPWSRFWLGSVADHVIKSVSVPILLIGGAAPPAAPAFRRILVPVDFHGGAGDLVELLAPFARLTGAELILLHVHARVRLLGVGLGMETPSLPAEADRHQTEEAEARLAAEAQRLRAAGFQVTHELRWGDAPAAVVTEMARPGVFDLIAITTRAPRGLTRLVLGSVADKVVRSAEVPVLVLHGTG